MCVAFFNQYSVHLWFHVSLMDRFVFRDYIFGMGLRLLRSVYVWGILQDLFICHVVNDKFHATILYEIKGAHVRNPQDVKSGRGHIHSQQQLSIHQE